MSDEPTVAEPVLTLRMVEELWAKLRAGEARRAAEYSSPLLAALDLERERRRLFAMYVADSLVVRPRSGSPMIGNAS